MDPQRCAAGGMQVSPSMVSSRASSEGPAGGGSGGRWHDENALPPASLRGSAATSRLLPRAQLPDCGPRQVPYRGRPRDLVRRARLWLFASVTQPRSSPVLSRLRHVRGLCTAFCVNRAQPWSPAHAWRRGSAPADAAMCGDWQVLGGFQGAHDARTATPQAPPSPPPGARWCRNARLGPQSAAGGTGTSPVANAQGHIRCSLLAPSASLAPSATRAACVPYWQLRPLLASLILAAFTGVAADQS